MYVEWLTRWRLASGGGLAIIVIEGKYRMRYVYASVILYVIIGKHRDLQEAIMKRIPVRLAWLSKMGNETMRFYFN